MPRLAIQDAEIGITLLFMHLGAKEATFRSKVAVGVTRRTWLKRDISIGALTSFDVHLVHEGPYEVLHVFERF